ncbi:MAG: tetratricopeptide repeat protein [Burkholderiaceae bacterium]
MKNALIIVTLTLMVSACADLTHRSAVQSNTPREPIATAAEEKGEVVSSETTAIDADDNSDNAQTDTSLPSVELTDDLLFKILKSEIAYQRGEWQDAYITLLAVAQQTRDPRIARRAVEVALSAKQTDKTLAAIRLWHELAPTSEEATQYYLGLIMLGDDLAEAQPIFEQRLKEMRPQARPLMMFQIQRLLARAKDKAAAFNMLERVLAPYQSTPETHLVLAEGALAKNDQARAQAEARIALTAKPDSELAALTMAQVAGDKTQSAKELTNFLRTHPKSHDVRIAYARILVEEKQYDKAQTQFELALKEQPEDLTSIYALGILANQNNNMKVAEKYLTSYLDLLAKHPNEKRDPSQALLLLAQMAEERHDTDAALKWLAQIESGDAYLGAQIKQAQIIAKRGDVPTARKLLQNIDVDNERDQILLITAEGQILRDANQMQDAFAFYDSALKRFPDSTDLLYDYAMLAEKNDKLDIMETMLRKVIKLAPESQHAYNALGYSFAERNMRLPEAYALIEKALQLAPEDPFIMDSMGWVQFRLGKLQEAETLLRRAYALRPDPEIAVHLGEVLWVKGSKDDAEKLWRDVKAKDPKNDTLKNTLARFKVLL